MKQADRQAIYERDQGICGFCGQPVPLERFHIDHVIPRVMGGADDPSNYRVAHWRCNVVAGSQARKDRKLAGLPGNPIVNVRFPGQVYTEIGRSADRERRSFAGQVLYIVERYLAEQSQESPRRV